VPLEQRGANLVTVGAGGILQVRLYVNRREALRVAGLEESAV
jgi:hypothetical protein